MSHTPALEDEEGRFPNADSGSSVVAVVQPAQASPRDHLSAPHRAGPPIRCLLVQPEVGPVVMVVGDVIREEALEMALVQRDDLIEQLATAATDPALRDSILPRALDRGLHATNCHGSNGSRNFQPILCVVIIDEELGRGLIGKRF